MCKKYTSILLFLLLAMSAAAQTYVPFPIGDAIWSERMGMGESHLPAFYCFGLKNGDTTINSVIYHKLYKSDDTTFTESEFYGGLREEDKRIYLFETGTERLIYDFNLNVGDTFRNTNPGPDGVVSAIDSVNINGQYRKRFSFTFAGEPNTPFFGNWIEGIGNSRIGGLTVAFQMQPTCDCQTDNVCFLQDNAWIYHNPEFINLNDCLPGLTALNDPRAGKQVTAIVPNPVTDVSRLLVEGRDKFDRMDVFDGRGIKIRSYAARGKAAVLIDRKEYMPGLYLYRLYSSGKTLGTGKFVIR